MSSEGYDNQNPLGFINPKHLKTREQKMSWTAENKLRLALYGLGREVKPSEYPAIANMFPEKPTPKAIQEQLTKLRAAQRKLLAETGLTGPTTRIHEVQSEETGPAMMSGGAGASPAENELPDEEVKQAARTLLKLRVDSDEILANAGLANPTSTTNPSGEDAGDDDGSLFIIDTTSATTTGVPNTTSGTTGKGRPKKKATGARKGKAKQDTTTGLSSPSSLISKDELEKQTARNQPRRDLQQKAREKYHQQQHGSTGEGDDDEEWEDMEE